MLAAVAVGQAAPRSIAPGRRGPRCVRSGVSATRPSRRSSCALSYIATDKAMSRARYHERKQREFKMGTICARYKANQNESENVSIYDLYKDHKTAVFQVV